MNGNDHAKFPSTSRAAMLAAIMVAAMAAAVLLAAAPASPAQAAAYQPSKLTSTSADYQTTTYKAKAGKVTVTAKGTFDYDKSGTFFKLTVKKKGGKAKVLTKKADRGFTTNGRYVYYAVKGARVTGDPDSLLYLWGHRKNTIYRYDVKTGAKKKIVKGTNIVPFCAQGSYLYYGKYGSAASDTNTLYARNVKSGKQKKLAGSIFDGICKGRVICHEWSNAGNGMPMYSYKKDGTGKVVVTRNVLGQSDAIKVGSKKIRYIETDGYDYRVVTCNAKGKVKKAVTGWLGYSAAQARL